MKYVYSALASLGYYFGFRKDIFLFEVLSWFLLSFAAIIISLGFFSLALYPKETGDASLKAFQEQGKAYWVISYCFMILNIWITWDTNFCYAYTFTSLMSMAYIVSLKETPTRE